MQRFNEGIHHFKTGIFGNRSELIEELAKLQNPQTPFITCSDYLIDTNLLSQTTPGELLNIRNTGNLVPPHDAGQGSEAATIKFAVAGLSVQDVIVCGYLY